MYSIFKFLIILFFLFPNLLSGQSLKFKAGLLYNNSYSRIGSNTMPVNLFNTSYSFLNPNAQIGLEYKMEKGDNLFFVVSGHTGSITVTRGNNRLRDVFWGSNGFSTAGVNSIQLDAGFEKVISPKKTKNKAYLVSSLQYNFAEKNNGSSSGFLSVLGTYENKSRNHKSLPSVYLGVKYSINTKKSKELFSLNAGFQQAFGVLHDAEMIYTPEGGPAEFVGKEQRAILEYRGFAFRFGITKTFFNLNKRKKK